MKRILVTGNAGSGKSTLARCIADRLALPLHGLDCVVWQTGWRKRAALEKSAMISKLVAQEAWVIDGVSLDVQSRADAIVFLDVPRRTSFLRVMKRNWRYLFRSRPGLPTGCPEVLIVPTLCKIIWNFPKNIRPRILEQHSASQRFFHIRTPSDLTACLAALDSCSAQQDRGRGIASGGASHVPETGRDLSAGCGRS